MNALVRLLGASLTISVLTTAMPAAIGTTSSAIAQDGHGEVDAGHIEDGQDHAAADDGHGATSHAAGGHEEPGVIPSIAQGLMPAITALVVFGIVFMVLNAKVWPKILAGLQDRENKIREEIAAAEAAQKQARAALEQYEQSLAEARAEAQKMIDEAKQQQQRLATELKAKADAEISVMRERATRDIEQAKRAALGEIYAEAATIATSVASKILQRELNPADQTRLVEESLSELSSLSS